jgi:hypothetical protein
VSETGRQTDKDEQKEEEKKLSFHLPLLICFRLMSVLIR